MTEVTQSMSERGSVAKVAMRVAAFRSITQTAGSFAILAEAGEPPYAAKNAKPQWAFERIGEDRLALSVAFGFAGQKDLPEAEARVFVRIDASFRLEYGLSEGEPFSDDDVTEFAKVNGLLNVLPFWREYVYSTLGRAALPRLLIPPFNPIRSDAFTKKAKKPDAPSVSTDSTSVQDKT